MDVIVQRNKKFKTLEAFHQMTSALGMNLQMPSEFCWKEPLPSRVGKNLKSLDVFVGQFEGYSRKHCQATSLRRCLICGCFGSEWTQFAFQIGPAGLEIAFEIRARKSFISGDVIDRGNKLENVVFREFSCLKLCKGAAQARRIGVEQNG